MIVRIHRLVALPAANVLAKAAQTTLLGAEMATAADSSVCSVCEFSDDRS